MRRRMFCRVARSHCESVAIVPRPCLRRAARSICTHDPLPPGDAHKRAWQRPRHTDQQVRRRTDIRGTRSTQFCRIPGVVAATRRRRTLHPFRIAVNPVCWLVRRQSIRPKVNDVAERRSIVVGGSRSNIENNR